MSADLFSVLLIHQRSPPGGPPLPEVRPCRFHPHLRPDPIASTSIEPMATCRPDHPAMGISSPRHQYSWWRVLASACGLADIIHDERKNAVGTTSWAYPNL